MKYQWIEISGKENMKKITSVPCSEVSLAIDAEGFSFLAIFKIDELKEFGHYVLTFSENHEIRTILYKNKEEAITKAEEILSDDNRKIDMAAVPWKACDPSTHTVSIH